MLAVLMFNQMQLDREKRLKINRSFTTNDSDGYCRTCLRNQDLLPLFLNKDTANKRTKNLLSVTGLLIKLNDGLSQKICTRCANILNSFFLFRRTCKKAESTLKQMAVRGKHKSPDKNKLASRKSKEKKPVVTKQEADEYQYGYGDDYMDCDDYDDEVYDSKIKKEDVKPSLDQLSDQRLRRKRQAIPTAPSYKCGTCSKEFRMKATYKAHMRFHTSYCICEACGKLCRNNNQLQEHKRARHGLGKIHKCTYCEYSSATKEALTIHERRHTGERPYICDHCGASFHRRANLVQHIAIHLPEKNFQCDMCPKKLKSRKFLQIHKHNAHTGRRYGYLCSVCDHRFEKPNKVRAHTRRVHGVPDDHQAPIVRVQL